MTDPNTPEQPAWQPQPGPFNWTAPGGTPWSGPGAWQLPAPPSVPPRRGRAAVVWSIVLLVAVIIAGTAGYEIGVQRSQISSAVQSAISGPCPAGKTAPDPSVTSPAGTALLARALPVPPGDTQITGADQGVLSLKGYVSALYTDDPAEQQRLSARCFQTAVHRAWSSPDGSATSVWLIQFGTPADARSYILSTEQADAADPANTDVFRIAHVADSMGLGNPTLDKYGNTLMRALGDAGNVGIIIHFYVPARTDNAAAASVLRQQSALLTAGSS